MEPAPRDPNVNDAADAETWTHLTVVNGFSTEPIAYYTSPVGDTSAGNIDSSRDVEHGPGSPPRSGIHGPENTERTSDTDTVSLNSCNTSHVPVLTPASSEVDSVIESSQDGADIHP